MRYLQCTRTRDTGSLDDMSNPTGAGGPQDQVPHGPANEAEVTPYAEPQQPQRRLDDMPVIVPNASTSPPGGSSGTASRSLVAFFSEIKRSGRWELAATTDVWTCFGSGVLDLREVALPAHEINLQVKTAFGELKVIVPPDVTVDVRGGVAFGEEKLEVRPPTGPQRAHLVITVVGAFGSIEVKTLEVGEVEPTWWQRHRLGMLRRRGLGR